MVDQREFQQRLQKLGGLVRDLDTIADPASRAAAKELVQLLMDLHGAGLERMLELVFQSGDAGTGIIDDLGTDPLVGSLLILYGIHPDDLETRIERKLTQIDSKLHKMGAEVKLLSLAGADLHLGVTLEGHACGSTSKSIRSLLEDAMYEAAPDMASLTIEGLEEPAASGFVGIEKLMGAAATSSLTTLASDGMD